MVLLGLFSDTMLSSADFVGPAALSRSIPLEMRGNTNHDALLALVQYIYRLAFERSKPDQTLLE